MCPASLLALANARLYDEVRRSEETYRRVLENSHDMIALVDLEGRITYANAAHELVLGYRVDELVGMRAQDLADEHDPPLSLKGGEPALPTRRLRRKDGSWALLEGSTVLLRSPTGAPEFSLVFARDVTGASGSPSSSARGRRWSRSDGSPVGSRTISITS